MALVDCCTSSRASRIRMFNRLRQPQTIEELLNRALSSDDRWADPRDEHWAHHSVYLQVKAEHTSFYRIHPLDMFPPSATNLQHSITIQLSGDKWVNIQNTLSRKLAAAGAAPHQLTRIAARARQVLALLATALPIFAFAPSSDYGSEGGHLQHDSATIWPSANFADGRLRIPCGILPVAR